MMYAVCKTDIGQLRRSNQDVGRCGTLPDGSAWTLVCDGMGGVNGGDIASDIAGNVIEKEIAEGYKPEMQGDAVRELLCAAVQSANRAVYGRAEEDRFLRGMGTTVVAAVAREDRLDVVHVGDSRCYLVSGEDVTQITTDHSYVQELVDHGAITEDEARFHPQRNLITRVVGTREDVKCDCNTVELKPGDIVISCSDGLSNYLEHDTLREFTERFSGEQLVEELVRFANAQGGRDNITVAVIENRPNA